MSIIEMLLGRIRTGKSEIKNPKPISDFDLKKKIYGSPPPGRVSEPDSTNAFEYINNEYYFAKPDFMFDVIPLIRKLVYYNEEFGQTVYDLMQLCNTGYRIVFDKKVKDDDVDKMRRHIINKSRVWSDGVAGMTGLINRFIAQLFISGSLCNEWVISKDLDGVDNIFMVLPETIRWKYNKSKLRWEPYQKIINPKSPKDVYRKLNQFTFKYYGLWGDGEKPYGIPPLMTALETLKKKKVMDNNVDHVMDQLGLLGFFEAKLEKPAQYKNENDDVYEKRLNNLLTQAKKNLSGSLKDGITVGFKEDHEFEFHSTTKNLGGVADLYDQKLLNMSKGLKHPPAFLAMKSDKSETHINIIFTKMLAQLNNVQEIIKHNLEFGFQLELRLAGFSFDFLEVEFNPSTITDKLKSEQAREIQIRNLKELYVQGIISQETYADEIGYEAADVKEPRVPLESDNNPGGNAKKKEDREKDKDKSDRKGRDKDKPQPKRKDQDTRER